MRIVRTGSDCYLEHGEGRIALAESDLALLRLMTPLGRKLYLRKKGKEIRARSPGDEAAALMIEWYGLRRDDWAFPIPHP